MPQYVYFGIKQALEHYKNILIISGSEIGILHGILNEGQLDSALEFIQNDDYYPDIVDKLSYLVFSIADGHCFTDGNKRTALVLGGYFLEINGYGSLAGRFFVEMENIVLWIAAGLIPRATLHKIVGDLVNFGEVREETKIHLLGVLEIYEDLVRASGLNNE